MRIIQKNKSSKNDSFNLYEMPILIPCIFMRIAYFCNLNFSILKEKPLILVSNDDGIHAKGLHNLIDVAREFGNVIVAAPAEGMSGMSHAITIKYPLRANKIKEEEGLKVYSCEGTPVDCVKLALNHLVDKRPDLVLSGINHGSNSSSSVVYSGTMAAAMEGCVNMMPSAGFSLLSYDPDADFSVARDVVRTIVRNILENGLEDGVCLNVNIPALPKDELMGITVCRQTRGYWKEEFVRRMDPHNREYFWLTGTYFNAEEDAEDSDEFILKQNRVSVVPITVDLTAYRALNEIKSWDLTLND